MKFLKKINKGLILTIIVLIALTIYLVGVEKQRKADKVDIKIACENFIQVTDKYSVLPEEMQTLTEEKSRSKEEEYIKEMKMELEKLMTSNKEAVDLQYKILESNLKNGYNDQEIRTKIRKEITKISNYEFDADQVTVSFKTKVETTSKYLSSTGIDENEEQLKQDSFETSADEIILRKESGKWKIVYANLQYNEYGTYYSSDLEIY